MASVTKRGGVRSGLKVLAGSNGKGGVGKTTTAVNVAALLAGKKRRVLLVDTDPQGSATWWSERSKKMPFELATELDPAVLGRLREVEGYDVVVVDSPPRLDSEGLQAVARAADYMILPTPPAPMDMAALIATIREVVQPSKVAYRVLLTRVDPRSLNEAYYALETLREAGVEAFNAVVRTYKAHERASLGGVPISSYTGPLAREAASDYRRVVDEVLRDW